MPFVYNYLDSMVMAVMKNKRKIFRQQKTPAIKAGAYFKIFFNSRTREGCDCVLCKSVPGTDYFNSRTRVGCDSKNKQKFLFASVRFLHNSPSKSVYSSNWSILVAIIWSFKYFFSANRPVIICALWARTINHTIIHIPSFSISCFLITLSVWRRE